LTDLYRGRAEAERVERGAQKALERALRAEEEERRQKEAALSAKEAALRREASALAEVERLRALLLTAGISLPDPR
jgi:hypothetical protein